MCGIIGIVGHSAVNQQLFDGLTVLQHRGQDSAGMATEHEGRLVLRKHNGLVREVFRTRHMMNLKGNVGIGHVRYPTQGTPSPFEAQPFYVNSPFGIVLAHNGNLINKQQLQSELFLEDQRHLNTQSDSEVLLNVFAQEITRRERKSLEPDDIFDAVCRVYERCKGAYSVVAMIVKHGIVAFRDPHGIRPLIIGTRTQYPLPPEYCVASESAALDSLGFDPLRDLDPGEVVYFPNEGGLHSRNCYPVKPPVVDLFEYVYLSRADSILDKVYVHKARIRMGKRLAKKIKREWPEYKEMFDIVIPIPSTSRIMGLELAKHLKKTYREGFAKNRYIGRTFIMPEQDMREKTVRTKLNPLKIEFKDKNVLLVDDSIVRGTTSKEIVQMCRAAGAKSVYLASASPPVRYQNIYGIDMPCVKELVAYGRSIEEIREYLGVDGLIYQDLEDLIKCVQQGNHDLVEFETSVFDGNYITGISNGYLDELEHNRSNEIKHNEIIDMEDDYEYTTL